MSKIFEALNKGQRDSLALVDLIDAETPPPVQAAGKTEGVAHASAPPAMPAAATVPAAETVPTRGSETPVRPERPAEPVSSSGIRTLPLRLAENSPILPFDNLSGRASEQYRIARTRILQHPKSPRIVLVSSPGSGDGKTITAINLAGALSLRAGFNVLLVDGDFRRSSVHRLLGLPEGPGLAEVLSGTCTLEDALVHVEQFPNLYVLPSGNCQANPAELLDSAQWIALQGTLKRRFRSIVVDSPPVASVADYDLLLAGADGVILVVRVDHTNRQVCLDTIRSIPPAKYMGVLLNCLEPWFLGKTYGFDDAYYSSAAAK